MSQGRLRVVPCAIDRASRFVAVLHRHHQPTSGGRFALAVVDTLGDVRGVAIVGTPVARMLALDGLVLEVLRVCTDGTPNTPSALYGAVARTARAMGASRIVTYTRKDESGASLRAAGWNHEADTGQRSWAAERGGGRVDRTELVPRQRWGLRLHDSVVVRWPEFTEADDTLSLFAVAHAEIP